MASDYLIHADCLTALADLPEATAHLIYLDPPFNTKVKRDYDDNFGSPQDYVAYMRPRLVEMARVLGRPHGHLKPSKVVVQRGARRPANSQLADDKLRALGYGPRTDFSDVARAVLREMDA